MPQQGHQYIHDDAIARLGVRCGIWYYDLEAVIEPHQPKAFPWGQFPESPHGWVDLAGRQFFHPADAISIPEESIPFGRVACVIAFLAVSDPEEMLISLGG